MTAVAARAPTERSSDLFDSMRLLAAGLVIVGHAWPLSGLDGVPTFAGIRIHHLGVYVFFAISGYLLASSWTRRPQAMPFLVRRAFRIFPALIPLVLVSVFALGPVATELSPSEYWSDRLTWQYLLLFAQYELPGVFTSNPQPVVNGSLWSLGVEFCCYLMLVLLGVLGSRASLAIRIGLAVGIAATIVGLELTGPLRTTAIAVVFFLLGSICARFRGLAELPPWPGLLAAVLIVPLDGEVGTAAAWIVVTYLVVTLGSRSSRLCRVVRRAGDPSYGMYLWSFPVQQVLIAAAGPQPVLVSIAVVLPTSVVLGYASWHLVENAAINRGAALSTRLRTHIG